MTRAHVYIIGGVPYLHITRPGQPAESREMSPAEVIGLMKEVARAALVAASNMQKMHKAEDQFAGAGKVIEDHSPDVGKMVEDHSERTLDMVEDDPPPCYVGAMGE